MAGLTAAVLLSGHLAPSAAYANGAAEAAAEAGTPPRLELDLERHVDAVLARHRRADLPHFEERVDVLGHSLESVLNRHLEGVDLRCAPSQARPPSLMEMRPYTGGSSIPFHADFLGPLKAMARLFRGKGPPRYFLYVIHREDGAGLALNEGPASEAARLGVPGATWEQVAAFSDLGRASAALRRLERGFAAPQRESDDEALPPRVETTCRPPGFD